MVNLNGGRIVLELNGRVMGRQWGGISQSGFSWFCPYLGLSICGMVSLT